MRLLTATTVFALILALAGTALALKSPAWQGKPAFKKGTVFGAFVWHDGNGLHARFTTRGKLRNFHGKVCTTKQIKKLTPFKLEKVDSARVGPKGHCVHFDLKTKDGVDGFDFRAPGEVLTWDFKVGNKQLATDKIRVGANSKHPANNPFFLNRN